jgi:5-methylcytosine-specific restriction endonuclease McrA
MIKLERTYTPIILTPSFVKLKTEEFKKNGTNVWNIPKLKEALINLGNGKCAYCQCDIKEESKYMEVEHFQDKDTYQDLVLNWDNLLPSCKRCNGSKSNHDVLNYPIINPFIDNPKTHLGLKLYRFKPKDKKGETTIDVVNLNHPERAVIKRFEVGEGLQVTLDLVKERLANYIKNSIIQRKNKLLNLFEALLKECQQDSIYSATCATILHLDDDYKHICDELKRLKLWTSEFEKLNNESKTLMYT